MDDKKIWGSKAWVLWKDASFSEPGGRAVRMGMNVNRSEDSSFFQWTSKLIMRQGCLLWNQLIGSWEERWRFEIAAWGIRN